MIIKFDHISFIASRKDREKLTKNLGEPTFVERNLPNIGIKCKLMRSEMKDHDLYFYDGGYPTEYIFYDSTFEESRIQLIDDVVYGHYSDLKRAQSFLVDIFGSKVFVENEKICCNMGGVLDRRDYWLVLCPEEHLQKGYLDSAGYGVVTIVMNNAYEKVPEDGVCTEYEKLTVNGRELEIKFAQSDSTDMIFEILRANKR